MGFRVTEAFENLDMRKPLITIGITCFNAEETITRAVNSALAQDWPCFEIVIVDDFSTDNSVQTIEEIKKENQRIRLYCHKENRGVAAARNTIVKHAKGEYITFFDDDDESVPKRLKKQYERLSQFERKHPNIPVLCYANLNFVEDSKKCILRKGVGHQEPEPHGIMVVDFFLLNKKKTSYIWGDFGTGTMMASKVVLKKFGFDPGFKRSEDWDIAIRVASVKGYFISVDETLITQHKTEAFYKSESDCLYANFMLLKKHKKKLLQEKSIRRVIGYCGNFFLETSFHYNFHNKQWRRLMFLIVAHFFLPERIARVISRRMKKYRWRLVQDL